MLYCPIRGQLKIKAKTKDELRFSEEKRRIDCIRYLLDKGYRKEYFQIESTLVRFGHGGRNAFRTDIVIFNHPAKELKALGLEEKRENILLVCEIKRDNKNADLAKQVQVKTGLSFLPDMRSIAIYWDDVEQKIFYRKMHNHRQQIIEAPIAYLPVYGSQIAVTQLCYDDLEALPELLPIFKRIENAIHPFISDVSIRYELLLKLLLIKIYDEGKNRYTNGIMSLQDFTLFELTDKELLEKFNGLLRKALGVYQSYLPRSVQNDMHVDVAMLRQVSKHLAPINLLEANPEAIQSFYMYFAKQLYKWDLAQYFTPYEVVDFIVQITNPQYGNTIKDPACGSSDFLVSALRAGVKHDPKIGERIYGSDNSANAVQVSILNMLLNGDGKSNITKEDSLENVENALNRYDIILCNPPFGIKIKETRKNILNKFTLGQGKDEQQTGILFAELCVRQAKPGGRIAIILPNGYLGNKSTTYTELRKWLLCQTKVACVIGFPRFTFKKSGADVSASVLVVEKRKKPLDIPELTKDYPVYVNLLDSVGWDIGNKQAKKIYKKDLETGAIVFDEDNVPVLDADFDEVLRDLYYSPVIHAFSWLSDGIKKATVRDGWAISIQDIISDNYLTLDPKRFNRKYQQLVRSIRSHTYARLTDLCDIVPQGWLGKKHSEVYRYVEIGNVYDNASYEYQEKRGWELPSRAKHKAGVGDIFIASVWGSVKKWFIADSSAQDGRMIITNGFRRLQLKPDKQDWLPDLISALSSEGYRVQMRALATGSDGLADVTDEDLSQILIPRIPKSDIRNKIQDYIAILLNHENSLSQLTEASLRGISSDLIIPQRNTNFSQV